MVCWNVALVKMTVVDGLFSRGEVRLTSPWLVLFLGSLC